MLVPITNDPRPYAWGSTTLLSELQGRAPARAPEAEIWFGDHPGSPAKTADGSGRSLDHLLTAEGQDPLPYLVKLLAAGSVLSLQVHPSKSQAAAGFAAEEERGIPLDAVERNYRDDNHKPELIVAQSDPFVALAGIRPLAATRELLEALGDDPAIADLSRRLSGGEPAAAVRQVLEWLFTPEAEATVAAVCRALADAVSESFTSELTELRTIAETYPNDPGVVVATLMNLIVLKRGEAIFVDAGVIHAYVRGLGVEIMAASDNVLRAGLTPKHIDVPELLRIADTSPGAVRPVKPHADAPWQTFAPTPDFRLSRADLGAEEASIVAEGSAVILATAGTITVGDGATQVVLTPGHAAFAASGGSLRVAGPGTVFVAQPGAARL